LSFVFAVAGLIWISKIIWVSYSNRVAQRSLWIELAVPIGCLASLPMVIALGVLCQELALEKAQELRVALLKKWPTENLYQAYSELCGGKSCGVLSYKIAPAGGAAGEKPYLIVKQFNEHRATVDLETGAVTRSDRTY
jgi:hypothetical protein